MTIPDIAEERYRMTAFRYCYRTARVEVTTRRGIEGTRYLPFQNNTFPGLFDKRISHRHRGEERLCVGMKRIIIEGHLIDNLDDTAQIHDGDTA